MTPEQIADQAYTSFCEDSTGNSDLQEAWDLFQHEYFEIESGDTVDRLVYQALLEGVRIGIEEAKKHQGYTPVILAEGAEVISIKAKDFDEQKYLLVADNAETFGVTQVRTVYNTDNKNGLTFLVDRSRPNGKEYFYFTLDSKICVTEK